MSGGAPDEGTVASVLITGASSGFGRGVALALAQSGRRVFASMRDVAKGASLRDDAGDRRDLITVVELDVGDPESVRRGVESVLADTGGTLDALLANAGVGVMGPFEELSDEACRRQMETNFFGTLAVAREVIPVMRRAGHGRIVVMSSNSVNAPSPFMSMYAASKWALEGWAEALAMELAPFGVDVRVVQPGAHRTPFGANVEPMVSPDSAYLPLIEAAAPATADLDRWGTEADRALPPIVRAVTEADVPFLTRIGGDSVAFGVLKGLAPYELRAWALRSITGLPGPEAAATRHLESDAASSVATEVLTRLAEAAARSPHELGALFALLMGERSAGG